MHPLTYKGAIQYIGHCYLNKVIDIKVVPVKRGDAVEVTYIKEDDKRSFVRLAPMKNDVLDTLKESVEKAKISSPEDRSKQSGEKQRKHHRYEEALRSVSGSTY